MQNTNGRRTSGVTAAKMLTAGGRSSRILARCRIHSRSERVSSPSVIQTSFSSAPESTFEVSIVGNNGNDQQTLPRIRPRTPNNGRHRLNVLVFARRGFPSTAEVILSLDNFASLRTSIYIHMCGFTFPKPPCKLHTRQPNE